MSRDDRMILFTDRTRTLVPMPALTPMPEPTYGKCTACGSVEVALNRPHGTTVIEGESDHYPVGYGCEVCD